MAMLLALFSCSGESLPGLPGKADAERVPLRVAGASAGAGIGVQQTRAGGRTELTAGSIGLFMQEDAAGGYGALTNLCFTYGSPFWQAGEQILLGAQNAHTGGMLPLCARKGEPRGGAQPALRYRRGLPLRQFPGKQGRVRRHAGPRARLFAPRVQLQGRHRLCR